MAGKRRALIPGVNDLATLNPKLASEWDYEANKGLVDGNGREISTPDKVLPMSGQIVSWIIYYDDPRTGKTIPMPWKAAISDRTKGRGSPYLSGDALLRGFNDLESVCPEVAKEWHPTLNGDLKPCDVIANSSKDVYWLLPYDDPRTGRHHDLVWVADIVSRKNGAGCPYLSNPARLLWRGLNDLATVNPELAKEWHPTLNGDLRPEDVLAGADKEVYWLLPYDDPKTGKHHDFVWKAKIASRNSGVGCPYLSGKAIWVGFNDLASTHPDLVKEWHPTLNGSLTPQDVTAGSHTKVWWVVQAKNPRTGLLMDLPWIASVGHRAINGGGCPYFSGTLFRGFNDLATTHPELAAEWHPTKNGSLTPSDVMAGSRNKVWWRSSKEYVTEDGEVIHHEWPAMVSNRALRGTGDPYVAKSKGEMKIKKLFEESHILFKPQYTFPDRVFKAPLRDDFAIFDTDGQVVGTVEFHGQQHYKPVDFAGKGEKWAKEKFELDKTRCKIKAQYLKEHGIPQLVIPYTKFNESEELVIKFIQRLSSNHEVFKSDTYENDFFEKYFGEPLKSA